MCDNNIIQKVIDVLCSQDRKGIDSGNWTKIKWEIRHDAQDGDIAITLPEDKIAFYFSKAGRFKGIVNWQD